MNTIPRTLLALGCLSALPTAAMAQNWEMTSGVPTQREIHRGTTEIRNCAGAGGVLSVGTATPPGGAPNTNMLVERLSSLASLAVPGFRYEYDTSQRPEQGIKVAEFRDGSGFAVVGSLDPSPVGAATSRFIVTKIDCSGAPVWRFSYGDVSDYNTAFDILQAATGTAGAGTQAGDLVALGKYYKPPTAAAGPVYRPRIARTRVNGTPIWVRDYQISLAGDFELQGLTELAPVAPNATGDLVAVGRIGTDAAILQVNGNTGAVVCTSRVRGLAVAQFHDVAAIRNTLGQPEIVAVGETAVSTTAQQQIYLARFAPNCQLRVHTHWGASVDREIAFAADLTGSTTFTGAPAGVLAIGGEVNGPYQGVFSQDAFLHLANPQSLVPYVLATGAPAVGQRYGTAGAGAEKAYAMSAAGNGAYFAGLSTTDWFGTGDPQHALTVRASNSGFKTQCSVPYAPPAVSLQLASSPYDASLLQKGAQAEPLPLRKDAPDQKACCAISP